MLRVVYLQNIIASLCLSSASFFLFCPKSPIYSTTAPVQSFSPVKFSMVKSPVKAQPLPAPSQGTSPKVIIMSSTAGASMSSPEPENTMASMPSGPTIIHRTMTCPVTRSLSSTPTQPGVIVTGSALQSQSHVVVPGDNVTTVTAATMPSSVPGSIITIGTTAGTMAVPSKFFIPALCNFYSGL